MITEKENGARFGIGIMNQDQKQKVQAIRRLIRGKQTSLSYNRQRVAELESDISALRLMLENQIKNDTETEKKP